MTNSNTLSKKNTTNIIPVFLANVIDICLVFMVYFICYLGFTKIPRISNLYQNHQLEAIKIQDVYKVEYNIGFKLYSDQEGYDNKYKDYPVYIDDVGNYKVITYDSEDLNKEDVAKYNEALNQNTDYGHERFIIALLAYEVRLFSIAISLFIFVFLIPFISKKRYTIGRLSSKTELISVSRTFEASRWQILGRFIFELLAIAVLGIYLNPIIVLLIILSLNALMLFIGKSGRTIRDFITGTKIVYNEKINIINNNHGGN